MAVQYALKSAAAQPAAGALLAGAEARPGGAGGTAGLNDICEPSYCSNICCGVLWVEF